MATRYFVYRGPACFSFSGRGKTAPRRQASLGSPTVVAGGRPFASAPSRKKAFHCAPPRFAVVTAGPFVGPLSLLKNFVSRPIRHEENSRSIKYPLRPHVSPWVIFLLLSLSFCFLKIPLFFPSRGTSSSLLPEDIAVEEAEAGVFGKRQMFLPNCGTIAVAAGRGKGPD